MNEELQTALLEVVQTTLDAKDFLLAELPEVIRQLLMWNLVYNFLLCLLFPIAAFAVYMIYRKPKNKVDRFWWKWQGESLKHNFEATEEIIPITIGLLGVLIVSAMQFNLQWLQIYIAPKVWLLEYAANLVK